MGRISSTNRIARQHRTRIQAMGYPTLMARQRGNGNEQRTSPCHRTHPQHVPLRSPAGPSARGNGIRNSPIVIARRLGWVCARAPTKQSHSCQARNMCSSLVRLLRQSLHSVHCVHSIPFLPRNDGTGISMDEQGTNTGPTAQIPSNNVALHPLP
jgi:hypothetical protein